MIRWLSILVVVYMLAALTWWTVLLHQSQSRLAEAQKKILQLQYDQVYGVKDFDISTLSELGQIDAERTSFHLMIHGEAIVFGIALILGIYYLYRLYRKELAVASQQKNFLLSITHELNSPLTSIKLVLETLAKRKLSSDQVLTLSENGLEETHRLESLVDKLLFSAKLESSYSFHLEDTDLASFISKIVDRYQRQYPQYSFESDLDPTLSASIDRESIMILINNLVENAMKYSDQRSTIKISSKAKNDLAVISVSDNGKGISKRDLPHIFDQFYRAGQEETRTTKGTGIGLYISQQIARAHKTQLVVKSEVNKGSTFSISLPNAHA